MQLGWREIQSGKLSPYHRHIPSVKTLLYPHYPIKPVPFSCWSITGKLSRFKFAVSVCCHPAVTAVRPGLQPTSTPSPAQPRTPGRLQLNPPIGSCIQDVILTSSAIPHHRQWLGYRGKSPSNQKHLIHQMVDPLPVRV